MSVQLFIALIPGRKARRSEQAHDFSDLAPFQAGNTAALLSTANGSLPFANCNGFAGSLSFSPSLRREGGNQTGQDVKTSAPSTERHSASTARVTLRQSRRGK
ncbi:hypothetical protein SKAU_G00413960 [Synaphobranchus kaupii]|uniref:Uncharacterized protein n=1 Tax=Synaphobranchus kaupii TaxID=118154 RepID=A0A9Q1I9F6_SYNKA|nr:hypothetical protein SKAU_G00413960 [Synaphobranchus kaupii]